MVKKSKSKNNNAYGSFKEYGSAISIISEESCAMRYNRSPEEVTIEVDDNSNP